MKNSSLQWKQAQWQKRAETRLAKVLQRAAGHSCLAKKGPKQQWQVQVAVVGSAAMKRLNREYRHKDRPTDVLSFPAPPLFRVQHGLLGDLVLCLPVLKTQARQLGHSPLLELDVLLVHGVLHLLGLDHEKSAQQAKVMAKWEGALLGELRPRQWVLKNTREASKDGVRGLIDRVSSSIE